MVEQNKNFLTCGFLVAGHATRPTWPPHQISSDKEVSVLPAMVVGMKACDNGRSTNSSDEFVVALVDIMLPQIVGEHNFSQLAVDPLSNTQTLQEHRTLQAFDINWLGAIS